MYERLNVSTNDARLYSDLPPNPCRYMPVALEQGDITQQNKRGSRELVAHKNYILVYDVTTDLVRVLRVRHAARQWPRLPDTGNSVLLLPSCTVRRTDSSVD
jgi:hypothetical protein